LDNTIVIGGGQLVVGPRHDHDGASLLTDNLIGRAMTERATTVVSSNGKDLDLKSEFMFKSSNMIPCAGLPEIGFVEPSLDVAGSHSGIMAGPLIGE